MAQPQPTQTAKDKLEEAKKKNRFAGMSMKELLPVIRETATKITKAVDGVAHAERDKEGREIRPAKDEAGELILALSVYRSTYAKDIRQYGGSDVIVLEMQRAASDARTALLLAVKKLGDFDAKMKDSQEVLTMLRKDHKSRHKTEVAKKAAAMKLRSKKLADDAALLEAVD